MPKVFEAPPGFVLNPDYLVPELKAQRDALLEALELLVNYTESCERLLNASPAGQVLKARAAIKAVEEGK